jgi:small-conductance mechanosensitive channel
VADIIEGVELADLDRAHFKGFGSASLDFEVVYYVAVPDYNAYMDIQQTINLALYEKFADQGIEFAYPTQTLYIKKEDGPKEHTSAVPE